MLGKAGNEALRRDQKSFAYANGGKARKFDDAGKSNLLLARSAARYRNGIDCRQASARMIACMYR